MPKPTLVLAGHSHAIALGVPPSNGVASATVIPVANSAGNILAVAGSWPRDDNYWSKLVATSVDAHPAIVWDGNQHQAYFLFAPSPMFDFILGSNPEYEIDPSARLVPEAYLRAFFAPSLEPLGTLLARIADEGGRQPLVIGTPPPKSDSDTIRQLLEKEPHFVALAEANNVKLADAQLTPPPMMRKLWALVQDMTREVAEKNGAVFVPVPAAACTVDGYLRHEHWSGDVTHANAAYGAAMVAEAVAAVGLLSLNESAGV